MKIPAATYRLQFTPSFGYKSAQNMIKYLHDLGVSHIYASPIFGARHASTHGYDVIAPNQLNTELGTQKEFEDLIADLKSKNIGWIQDIVPNHMAFDSQNHMLMDVFKYGKISPYYNFFDIDWDHPLENIRGRLLAPFLGRFYGECLEDGEIQLQYRMSGLYINYYELSFPLRVESYEKVFCLNLRDLQSRRGSDDPIFSKFLSAVDSLKAAAGSADYKERIDHTRSALGVLWELYENNQDIKIYIDEIVDRFNGIKGVPDSFNLLDELLSEQLFRLSFWKVATEEINYRRFFNINQLISMRVEEDHVFQATHSYILKLVWEDFFDGLRIDHVDGLYDPEKYLQKLRQGAPDAFIIVEKILHPDEELAPSWQVQGTTGYDFMNYVNGLFCERRNDKRFDKIYSKFIGRIVSYDTIMPDRKRLIIGRHMAGDVDRIANILKLISSHDRYARDITLYGLKRALVEILALFPVYRTYINNISFSERDRTYIMESIARARESNPALALELNFIERFLLLRFPDHLNENEKKKWINFTMSFQQLTGPLMAKGFEDTTLYIYNKLLSLNDVGGFPKRFGLSPLEFHYFNKRRFYQWPHTINTTSTHDTKRGEDVRARLNVLSEMPDEWSQKINSWKRMNWAKKTFIRGKEIPDSNDEYFYYQTLVGAFPFEDDKRPEFLERVKKYMIKAVREAKVHTAWLKNDETYENGFLSFIDLTLSRAEENRFLDDFLIFKKKISHYGIFNSLSQVILKMTCPGIPDFYQGSELWDLNLVDPDNRREVDFTKRRKYMADIMKMTFPRGIKNLFEHHPDGKIKMYTISKVLKIRQRYKDVFEKGNYLPLAVEGKHKNHILAFSREYEKRWIVTVVPRRFVSLISDSELPIGNGIWKDTSVRLPDNSPGRWQDALTGETLVADDRFDVAAVFGHFPGGVLVGL